MMRIIDCAPRDRSVDHTTSNAPRRLDPIRNQRSSSSEWESSSRSIANGSNQVAAASSKVIPCFSMFAVAFSPSQVNRSSPSWKRIPFAKCAYYHEYAQHEEMLPPVRIPCTSRLLESARDRFKSPRSGTQRRPPRGVQPGGRWLRRAPRSCAPRLPRRSGPALPARRV